MKKTASIALMILTLLGFGVLLSSCAVTIQATDSTTDTLANATEGTTDFTSSTSPGDEEGSAAQKAKAFTIANFSRIREDMARGSGEHLASLAHLLGVSETHRSDFFALSQKDYPVLFHSPRTTPEVLLAGLNEELSAHPEWRQ